MSDTTIRFMDTVVPIVEGEVTFKIVASCKGAGVALGGSPPEMSSFSGMENRFNLCRSIVEDLIDGTVDGANFLSRSKHPYLKPGAMMAILAIENGPVARGGPSEKGMLFVSGDVTSKYNPRVTSASNALNVPQVTRDTGQEYGNDVKDHWNYGDSIRASINYFNYVLHYVEIKGNRDATLLTAAMAYNAGHGYVDPVKYWGIGETREYAKRYFLAHSQLVQHYYPLESPLIQYEKYVTDYKLSAD